MLKNYTAVTQNGNEFYSKVRYFGLACSIGMFGLGVFLAANPGNSGEPLLVRSIAGGIMSTVVAWMAWVLAIRPRVTLLSDSIRVRNWIIETVVPYGCIARVRTSDGLVFELKDGYELRGSVVSKSIIGEFGGYPSAKRIRREIQPFLRSEGLVEGGRVQEKFSLSLQVPLMVVMLNVLCYVILKYTFQVS